VLLIIKCATILKKLHLVDSDFHDFNTRAHHNIKQPRKGQSLAHLENHNKTYEYAKRFAEKKSNTYSEIQTHGAIRALFCNTRKSLAEKLQNPRLLKISFHAFRHWKATTLYYHQTKSLPHVKEFLGHAEIDNTLPTYK